MADIYETSDGKIFLLYTYGNRIIFRSKPDDSFRRPVLLTSDYLTDLSGTIYNETVYYSYINEQYSLVTRSAGPEPNIIHQTAASDTPLIFHPRIAILGQQILLFHVVREPRTNDYTVRCVLPFQKEKNLVIQSGFPVCPSIRLLIQKEYIIISLVSDFLHRLLFLDTELTLMPLYADTGTSAPREPETEALKKEITRLNAVIASAAAQYNELMHTATLYRDEVLKWRNKFYGE